MGTRSLTVFNDGKEEIAVMYRQYDGYPEGHGLDLADFLMGKTLINGIGGNYDATNAFNGMGCLTASVIAYFKDDIGNIYVRRAGTRDCGEEYIYTVYGSIGEQIKISVTKCWEDETVFDGYAYDFRAWLDNCNKKI